MANDQFPKYGNQIAQDEHDNSSAPFTKRVLLYLWDAVGLQKVRARGNADGTIAFPGISLPLYDYMGVTYPDGVTEVYTFKTGGSGGTTVTTLTLVYTDSSKASIQSLTKS